MVFFFLIFLSIPHVRLLQENKSEPTGYSWSAVLYKLYTKVFPKSVHILGMPVLYQLICMVYHGNHVIAHASDATLIVRFASTSNSSISDTYCTKYKTFQFTLPAGNLFTQENESRS